MQHVCNEEKKGVNEERRREGIKKKCEEMTEIERSE